VKLQLEGARFDTIEEIQKVVTEQLKKILAEDFSNAMKKLETRANLCTRSVNKVMRLIQYNSVLTFKLQIEFVPFKIVPLGGYTPPETLFPFFVATLVVANRNRF